MSLWLEGATVPASRGYRAIYFGLQDWLAGWTPMALLLAGFLAATLLRKAIRITLGWKPLRWLLDVQ